MGSGGCASGPVAPDTVGVDPKRLSRAVAFVDQELEKGSFPGAALVATRGGRLFLEHYVGTYCNGVRRDVPFGPDVVNMVYSFSKGVTATVVAMVHQDGLLDYDDPVCRYIPEFAAGGKEAITVRHCLTHSAGIPGPPMSPALGEEAWQRNLEVLCDYQLEWEPGSKTHYHGWSGPFAAAAVVRRVCGGRPWHEICRERVFEPLGTTSMTFALPPEDVPVALTPQPGTLPVALEAHAGMRGHPGGGCFARVDDMLRLLNLHLNGGVWEGRRLLQEKTFAEMHRVQFAADIEAALARDESPVHEYWALGWLTRGRTTAHWFGFGNVVSERAFGHAGISTVIGVADPETELALAFLTTDAPESNPEAVRLRNTVTNLVASAVMP